MRHILVILALIYSFAAHGKTTIFFLNGIDGYDAKNRVSAEKF